MYSNKDIIEHLVKDRITSLQKRAEEQRILAGKIYSDHKENWKEIYKLGMNRLESVYDKIEELNTLAMADWKDSVRLNFILLDLSNCNYNPVNTHMDMLKLIKTERDPDIKKLKEEELHKFINKREELSKKVLEGYLDLAEAIIEMNCATLGVTLKEKNTEDKKIVNKI